MNMDIMDIIHMDIMDIVDIEQHMHAMTARTS